MRISLPSFVVLLLAGCTIEPISDYQSLPPEGSAALLRGARYVSNTSSALIFDAEVVVLNSYYVGFDNNYLSEENFEFKGQGSYTIESFSESETGASPPPSSTVLLIDQSGSWLNTDAFNTRSQAIKKFLENIIPPDNFLVTASSRQGNLADEPLEAGSQTFGNDWKTGSNYVFNLSQRTGGTNAMLDAASDALDLLIEEPVKKHLILLIHGNDEQSVATTTDLILKANEHDVSIHVIAVGQDVNTDEWAEVCEATGGWFISCSTDRQMVKVFSELERLTNGVSFGYKMRIRFTPASGLLQAGTNSFHKIEVNDDYLGKAYNPVYLTIKIPS